MAELLKGAPVADAICARTREKAEALGSRGILPVLAIVRVGENDADVYYERSAMRRCEKSGVGVENVVLPASVSQAELLAKIRALNGDARIHGVLIFRPLPKAISDEAVRAALAPEKDVDGITDGSLAGVFTQSGRGFCPCTAQACAEILDYYGIDCTGRRAVVLGRSLVVGKPVSQLLLARNATVTVCHTRTRDLPRETKRADILIAAAGHAGTVGLEHVAAGQIVIDVGINTDSAGKLCGDVKFDEVEPFVTAITPVPGGVGTVTTSVLVSHVVEAAERQTRS